MDNTTFLNTSDFWYLTIFLIFLNILVLIALGFYSAVLRFAGFSVIKTLFISNTISSIALYFASNIFVLFLPRSIPIIYFILSNLLLGSSRLFIKYYLSTQFLSQRKNVLIYGAGKAGRKLLANLEDSDKYNTVGFLDDNQDLHKRNINGIRIYSPDQLTNLLSDLNIQSVLLALPNVNFEERYNVVNKLAKYKINIKTIPKIDEILSGDSEISSLQDLDIKELLSRKEIKPIEKLLLSNIEKKTVMVTGAGGSIGSELARQIVKLRPEKLILVDHSEYALYSIKTELEDFFRVDKVESIEIFPIILNIRDKKKLDIIFKNFKINTLFHAAAYKHVPLLELNVVEGIENNVFGTLNVVNSAISSKVDSFILISTDKAVNPSSVMGATKRLAELICQSNSSEKSTKFSIVRFGNVLGSSGSVIPRFRKQIKNNGPVTVTSPEMQRYVMTIQEASQLVIQAAAISEKNKILILDMGQPIKIVDLAKKMIHLSGKSFYFSNSNKDGDIEIKFTGIRDGEKYNEELLYLDNTKKTIHPRIMIAEEPKVDKEQLLNTLKMLEDLQK